MVGSELNQMWTKKEEETRNRYINEVYFMEP